MTDKLKQLPAVPGVYFFRDAKRKIIYIGKASILKNRVRSYFQKRDPRDYKTHLLVKEIADLEWIELGSEAEALFLESEFIKRYRPKYNIDWKDEKNFIYVKVPITEEFPTVTFVRRPMDDRAQYYGPFTSSDQLRRAMKGLRKVFPYVTHQNWPKRGCLQYHLGLCPGPEEGAVSSADYKKNLRKLSMYLAGQGAKLTKEIERQMQQAAHRRDFEQAAKLRDQLRALQSLGKQVVFGDKETFDLTLDQALVGLQQVLALTAAPRRIEAYDISNFQGTDAVASMIVFQDGVPNRDEYRRFKMRVKGPNDFAMMREVILRRFSGQGKEWPGPDLILIDGGKGQLASALSVLIELGIGIPIFGLAKREEEIIRRRSDAPVVTAEQVIIEAGENYQSILLPHSSPVLQLLQRVRDEAHRFAVTYHSILRAKRQTKSVLEDIPGVGPASKRKLLKTFGSLKAVKEADLAAVAGVVGASRAKAIKEHLA